MSEQKVILGVEEFNTLTSYLMNRPYKEVNQLLDELRQSASIVELPTESEEEDTPDE